MRRTHLLLLGAIVALVGCDPSGPSYGPPSEITMSSLPQSVNAGSTITGITVTVKDQEGRLVPGATVEWAPALGSVPAPTTTTSDEGVARTDWTVGTTTGSQALQARVDALETTRTVSVSPGPLAAIVITPETLSFESVGDTVIAAAQGQDEYGNVIALSSIAWTSSATAVATVQNGVVVSQGAGEAEIMAEAAGISGAAPVAVTQVMAGIRISPSSPVVLVDETVQLDAVAVDARGSAIDTTLDVTWASADPQVASVDQEGRLTGHQTGTTVISAHAGEYSDEATAEVRTGERPTITGIAPSTLSPGDTVTITGTGFSTTAAENQVTVAGHELTLISATSTQIRAEMPPPGFLPCGPTQDREVVVSVFGIDAAAAHPVAGAAVQQLAAGESVALHGAQVACNELAQGGTYVVNVFNTHTSPIASTGFRLRGSAPAGMTGDVTAAAIERVRIPAPVLEPDPEAEAHHWMLEQNARLLRELTARTPRTAPPMTMALQVAPASVGDTRGFRIPDLDAGGSLCANYIPINARAVFAGDNAVIWEDTAAPLAGEMDDRWQQVGQEYESVMDPILREYFGDPQAYDFWLENQGRVHMLFSRHVNTFERGVNGFVFSGDFFPTSQCPQSNSATVFYARIPTEPGSGYSGYTADTWAWSMRATIIHEVKHIISYATKLRLWRDGASASPNYEVTWLEEATARLSEEFYARAVTGYGQGDNVTYQESIYKERRVGDNWSQYDHIPNMMYKHFGAVYQYYKNVESLSPLGPAIDSDWTFYGSGWLLVRWAMDHSGQSEQAFSRALVDEPSRTGVANLSHTMGRPFRDMMADFTLAMMTDEHPSGVTTKPDLRFPGWNTRNIMLGMYEDHQGTPAASTYDRPWPLAARGLSFGTFDRQVDGIRGGTATFFQLTGSPDQKQLLELLSTGGATAPDNLGMAIVRIQ